jgi:hypothetical protein
MPFPDAIIGELSGVAEMYQWFIRNTTGFRRKCVRYLNVMYQQPNKIPVPPCLNDTFIHGL